MAVLNVLGGCGFSGDAVLQPTTWTARSLFGMRRGEEGSLGGRRPMSLPFRLVGESPVLASLENFLVSRGILLRLLLLVEEGDDGI